MITAVLVVALFINLMLLVIALGGNVNLARENRQMRRMLHPANAYVDGERVDP